VINIHSVCNTRLDVALAQYTRAEGDAGAGALDVGGPFKAGVVDVHDATSIT
jgi:hypothetical protein